MVRLFLMLVLLAGISPLFGQLTPETLPVTAPGEYVRELTPEQLMQATSIWSEDFSNGIPSDWLISDTEGAAQWEYRGPTTDPDNTVGSLGACAEDVNGEPLESLTPENGFVIFDSAFWDDPIGPCGNLGSGEDPGPHFAPLTTPVFSLADYEYVAVRFNHFYTQWINNSVVYAEVSVDGGNWTQIWEPSIETGFTTPMDEEVILDLSTLAGGAQEVQLRWVFDGVYYWWMIDDIEVFELPLYDMGLQSLTYSNFDPFSTSSGDFSGLEYTIYPDEMEGPIRPRAAVRNDGAVEQYDVAVAFSMEHLEEASEVYSHTSSIDTIPPQQTRAASGQVTTSPAVIGTYDLMAMAGDTDEDPSPENNLGSRQIKISDVEYARDQLAMDAVYVPSEDFYNLDWEQGNMFMITGQDQDAVSISAGLAAGSNNLGTTMTGKIYFFNLGGGIITDLVAETQAVTASTDDLNAFGEGQMVTLPFSSPVTLLKDSAYCVVVGNEGGANNLWYAQSGESPDYSSWVKFDGDQWFYLETTPMVRLNFGIVDDIAEEPDMETLAGLPYPIPAQGQVNFPLRALNPETYLLEWIDMQGRMVLEESIDADFRGDGELHASTPGQPGVYSVRVRRGASLLGTHTVLIE